MSADAWKNCPTCKHNNCVRIDGLSDYELTKTGDIVNNSISGWCTVCGNGFGRYKGHDNKSDRNYRHDCEEEGCEVD